MKNKALSIKRIFKYKFKNAILRANYYLNNYREVVWLIGDGRSGTTWLADLINHDKSYREMFEPFHPELIPEMRSLLPHQYLRPNENNLRIKKIVQDVFSGKFCNPRVDSENNSIFYNGLIVKDIFANLFACWAINNFPHVKTILLIRNPFSVALSKQKKKDWLWMADPLKLLEQDKLLGDYLLPYEKKIREICNKNNYLLSQILIWSIINYVPLKQFSKDKIHVVFYEDVVTNPDNEVYKISQFIHPGRVSQPSPLPPESINKPSRVCGDESNILSGTSPVTSWKEELSPDDIDDGVNVLRIFGFDKLYNENGMPNHNIIKDILL